MPALHVAVDLTALEPRLDRAWAGSLPVRFTAALIRQAPTVTFAILERPETRAALAHLAAANARHVVIAEPGQLRLLLSRFEARLRRRFGRSRFAEAPPSARRGRGGASPLSLWQFLRANSPLEAPPSALRGAGGARWRPGRLARLGSDVVFCPFTSSGFSDPSVPVIVAVDDLRHVSHPHLLTSAERTARANAFGADFRRAARIVCSTSSLRDVALQTDGLPAERVLSVAPGRLLTHPAATHPATAATLARHGLEQNRFVLLVADLEPRHNHRLVLTALAMFHARCPDAELRLVCVGGPDSERASFNTIAAQMGLGAYVQFVGALGRDETSALIAGSRAVLTAALYETVAETVLEAMQRGRPVLCSQIPGLAELTDGAALTFDPHRPADLAAAFQRVEGEPALLGQLARLGRARVEAMADAQQVADAYLGVFREAMSTCPPSR